MSLSAACTLLALAVAGCSENDGDAPVPAELCGSENISKGSARLLTRSEYAHTIRDLLGTELDPTARFPVEPVVDGFNNNAASHQANPLLVEKYADSAALLAQEIEGRGFAQLIDCGPEEGRACAELFVDSFGLRAYRRPLTDDEKTGFMRLYDRSAPTFGHEPALGAILESMLQAPQFLYRVEAPTAKADSTAIALGPYELASRLSYFLWGSMPDDELLEEAAANRLSTVEQIEAQARRLLANERARLRVREFHSQWLDVERLHSIARNDAPKAAVESWEESLLRFTDRVFWSEGSRVSELYNSDKIYVDDTLAALYGIDRGESEGNWTGIRVPNERFGLLTQPGFMALHAHAAQSSPIQRGVFIRERLFCQPVDPPPPSVNNNPPDPDPNLTTRERFAVHTEQPACARCHELIDPLGFGFEGYDQVGRFRTEENGLPIDTSGGLVELEEESLNGPFATPQELAQRVAESETVLSCLGEKWFTFALGRPHSEKDECSIDQAVASAAAHGGSLQELLIALTTTDSFRYRKAHESDGKANP